MMPTAAMMTVFRTASQKNARTSDRPSSRPVAAGGVEPPGVGVYGQVNESSGIGTGLSKRKAGSYLCG